MEAYNRGNICEIVGLFLLDNSNKFDKTVLIYIETTDLIFLKISTVIIQIKYTYNSTNYLRNEGRLSKLNAT